MTDTETARPRQLVGRNLRRLRQNKGFSQRRLVVRMRALDYLWHQTTVQAVEKGTRTVSVDELFALAVCLDTDVASLLDPVPLGVVNVDVGLPWPEPADIFRWLIPVPEQQGIVPRHVDSAGWQDEKPMAGSPYRIFAQAPAGEAELRRKLQGTEEELLLAKIDAEMEKLRAAIAKRKAES